MYAVIDLGSNSFHMLIAKSIAGGLQTIGRVKRKVRLAAGLDKGNVLSTEAMQRGWECLALFAERLQDIPDKNITIVATATLRLATNADVFKNHAEKILGHNINVISGELEARTIYKGVAHTSSCTGKQLVIDIGGASTEVVIGKAFDALHYKSLNMGCVTYLERYFKDCQLSKSNFNAAIKAARTVIDEISPEYKAAGWQIASGASGTSGLIFGGTGFIAVTQEWNGTSWTEVADLATGRDQLGGTGQSALTALAFGGRNNGGALVNVEEWTVSQTGTNSTITD